MNAALPVELKLYPEITIQEPKKPLFGRQDLADVYYKTKEIIFNKQLFRICTFTENKGRQNLTICNLWRLTKLPDGDIRIYEFNLRTEQWKPASLTSLKEWPSIPIFSIRKNQTGWWANLIRAATNKALSAAGYDELPYCLTPYIEAEWSEEQQDYIYPEKAVLPPPECTPFKMKEALMTRFLGRTKSVETGHDLDNDPVYDDVWTPGKLSQKSMVSGVKSLTSIFYQHFYDKAVISAALTIDFHGCSLKNYLRYYQYREGLLKVAREHHNLLPLLPLIHPRAWSQDNLFSRKTWVKTGKAKVAIELLPIKIRKNEKWNDKQDTHAFRALSSPAAWRWLMQASPVFINKWIKQAQHTRYSAILIQHFALACSQITAKIPVIALTELIKPLISYHLSRGRFNGLDFHPQLPRFIQIYLIHCTHLWTTAGYKACKSWCQEFHFGDCLDYLYQEGFAAGYPHKNTTITSLERASKEWHDRIALQEIDGLNNYSWDALIDTVTINGVTFQALTDHRSVAMEGMEMRHCVRSYACYCYDGRYQVYSVKDEQAERSTLGLTIDPENNTVAIEQHQGKFNTFPVSDAAKQAAVQFVRLYQQALTQEALCQQKNS